MVYEIVGDLLTVEAGVICHQVNSYGVMGGGIAAAIRTELLTPEQLAEYEAFCNTYKLSALGRVQFIELVPGEKWLANMFSQSEYYQDMLGRLTVYPALQTCLTTIRGFAEAREASVALPANVGCGIAGGDWDRVQTIIHDVFDPSSVPAYIVKREKRGSI